MPQKLTRSLAQKIMLEYCEGELQDDGSRVTISLEKLIKKHDVAKATLYRRASKEGWSDRRTQFLARTRETIQANRIKDMAAEAGKLDRASLRIAQGFLGRVASQLMRAQQIEDAGGESQFTPEQLRSLSAAAMNAQKIGKLALGEANEIQKVNADVTVPDSFRRVMSDLHELRAARAETFSKTVQ